jgi:hypothetical protein
MFAFHHCPFPRVSRSFQSKELIMRLLIAGILLALCVTGGPAVAQRQPQSQEPARIAAGDRITTVFALRRAGSADVAARLRLQASRNGGGSASGKGAGIDSIVDDPRTNSVIVTGTAKAIAELRARVESLDVIPRFFMVKLNILRFDFTGEGDWDVRVVSAPMIKTVEDTQAKIQVQGDANAFAAEITPHLNADGSIGIDGSLSAAGMRSTYKRSVQPGSRAILAGATDSGVASIRKTVAVGRIPAAKGEPFSVFFLQVISIQESTR